MNSNQSKASNLGYFDVESVETILKEKKKERKKERKKRRPSSSGWTMCVQNYIFASPSVSLPVSLSSTSVFLILLSPDRSARGQTSSETEKNSSISLLNEVVATVVVTRGETRHDEQHSAMGGVIVIRMSYVSVPVFHILDRNGRWPPRLLAITRILCPRTSSYLSR